MGYTPEENRAYLKKRYQKQREFIIEFLGGKCVACGETDDLEVDHIDWRTKELKIGQLHTRATWHLLLAELGKCQLLCNFHHREKTRRDMQEMRQEKHDLFPPAEHGKMYLWMKKKCKCDDCNKARTEWNNRRNEKRREKYRAEGRNSRGPYGQEASHGDILMYRRGCKCQECRAANAEYARTLVKKKSK